MVFWSTIAGPVFNPETSQVADKTEVALGAHQRHREPARHPRRLGRRDPEECRSGAEAGRLAGVLTWITSKEFNKYSAEQYNIDPSRNSTFNDPELVAKSPYLPIAGEANATGQVIETSILNDFFAMNDMMNVEFNKALIGGQTAEEACAAVQTQWEDTLRKAGVLA